MAYSDYGGYAYRNFKRVEERSDATISPDGDIFGSPGMWPGFAALALGADEYERRKNWPEGHVVLGDGPIYVALCKQSSVTIYRANEALNKVSLLKDMPPEAICLGKYVDEEYFRKTKTPCVFEVDGCRIEVYFLVEDNHYQYAQLTQPDGNVWMGFSGYGVGAGLEDAGRYSTETREDKLWDLFSDPVIA